MNIKRPLPRLPFPDISHPVLEDLISFALMRMRHIVEDDSEILPPRLFPLAESMRWDFFTFDEWDRFGDLETEYGRLAYTLSTYPERGPPSACENELRYLLSKTSVLSEWEAASPVLKMHAAAAVGDVSQSQCNGALGWECTTKADYVTKPIDYEVSQSASEISLQLWKRSLGEMATQLMSDHPVRGVEFLQIHAWLKDPIYGFTKPFKLQHFFFAHLLNTFQKTVQVDTINQENIERAVAQAAQESSLLANPLLDKITLIHFHAHHQLPYANVSLDSLARAEFSVPLHVLEVAEEMVLVAAANDGEACPLVPILVTTRPSFSDSDRSLTPIVDGNHRATAAILLRFLADRSLLANLEVMSKHLLEYCKSHRLGKKWQIDLLDVLNELYNQAGRRFYDLILVQAQLVRKFSKVKYIPALVVQEEDFHTICKQRSAGQPKPVLLHPFHQTLFNDDDLPFALPQKAGQTHGRPEAFRLLPLTPFGTGQHYLGVSSAKTFKANLRTSMNGLVTESAAVDAPNDAEEERIRSVEIHVQEELTVRG